MRRTVGLGTAMLLASCADVPTALYVPPETTPPAEWVDPEPEPEPKLLPPGRAFLTGWRGSIELPPLPGETNARAWAISSGSHTKEMILGSSGGRATVWQSTSEWYEQIDAFVPRELVLLDSAVAANRAGQILGVRGDRPVVWQNGEIVEIATPAGYEGIEVTAISNAGHVVGTAWTERPELSGRGFVWHDGEVRTLPPLGGDESTRASFVNSTGTVVGVSRDADTGVATIVVWADTTRARSAPISTRYDHGAYVAGGISDPTIPANPWVPGGDVLISARAGGEIVLWRDGNATRLGGWTGPYGEPLSYWGLAMKDQGVILLEVASDDPRIGQRYATLGSHRGELFIAQPMTVSACMDVDTYANVICNSPQRRYPFVLSVEGRAILPGAVTDLRVADSEATRILLEWTEVDDGTGNPARYRVRYARPPMDEWPVGWPHATVGCDIVGRWIGARTSCIVEGLEPSTTYDFQLLSYRLEGRCWVDKRFSNYAFGETEAAEAPAGTGLTPANGQALLASAPPCAAEAKPDSSSDGPGRSVRAR